MGNCCTRGGSRRHSKARPIAPPPRMKSKYEKKVVPSLVSVCIDQFIESLTHTNLRARVLEPQIIKLPEPIIAEILEQMIVRQLLNDQNVYLFRHLPLQQLLFKDYTLVSDRWLSVLFSSPFRAYAPPSPSLEECEQPLHTPIPEPPKIRFSLLKADFTRCPAITDDTVVHLATCLNLTKLILDECQNISNDGVASLKNVRDLQYLSLRQCHQITDVGLSCLSDMDLLGYLDLSGLQEISDYVPQQLQRKTRLKFLSFESCSNLTDEGFQYMRDVTSLEHLNLGYCFKLCGTTLRWVWTNHHLKWLNIASCKLREVDFPHLLAKLPFLIYLNMSNVPIGGNYVTPKLWPSGIEHLYISRTKFTKLGFLSELQQLKTLDLAYLNITSYELGKSLKLGTSLENLNLESTTVDNDVMASIGQLKKLQKLNVSENDISDDGFRCIENLTEMRHLNCSFTEIGNSVLRSLQKLPHLETLHIDCSRITDEGMKYLEHVSTLKYLDLLGASISDEGLASLMNLEELRGLETIFNPNITDKGIEKISKIDTLTSLNISSNIKLSDESLKSLSHLPYLQNLNISGCTQLTQQSLKLIRDARSIRNLNIYGCKRLTNSRALRDLPEAINVGC